MTAKVITTNEDEHVHELTDKMTDGRFRHLLVAECEYEHPAMREYIAIA